MTYACTLYQLLTVQAQMGSIVTVPWGPVNIHSLQELMESDLKLKAPWKLQQTLHKSDDDPVIRAIVARLQPVSTITELVDQLQSQRKQNFAYLMYRRSLMFYASQSVSPHLTSCTLRACDVTDPILLQ
jgi:hypothetical protein